MELDVPYYHHEFVKRALVMAADDSKDHNAPLLLKLLSQLASSGAITQVCHKLPQTQIQSHGCLSMRVSG